MNARIETLPSAQYLADTHEVSNLSSELWDYNMYTGDAALCEAVQREGGQWAEGELSGVRQADRVSRLSGTGHPGQQIPARV